MVSILKTSIFLINYLEVHYVNSKFALRFLAALIAGGTETAYDLTSYLIGKLISAF